MNSKQLSKQHLNAMALVISKMSNYLFRVLDRMNRTGFPADDELRQVVSEAHTALHKLWLHLTWGPYQPSSPQPPPPSIQTRPDGSDRHHGRSAFNSPSDAHSSWRQHQLFPSGGSHFRSGKYRPR